MKSLRFKLFVVLISLSTAALAQSDAQESFDKLKTLAGSWQGTYEGTPTRVTLRVTSRGNAIVHEMKEAGTPDDPTRYDDPITMIYREGERLILTHYCDAGNRPRMAAKMSRDGKTVEFDFLDVVGSNEAGHMHHAVFTMIDSSHHVEDWTYMLPGDKLEHAHLDLQRTK
jgi:hypothetical protein